ncbi:MAG: sulfatase-like hydrolase/transferase, partial [Planctomycetota bacterium JB042]
SAPVCSPSRAALLTGRVPHRAGVPGNVAHRPDAKGLPADEVTMAEMFRAAGHATAIVGKWHLGHAPDERPRAQGFDRSFVHRGGCIDNWSHYFYWAGPNRHDLYRDGDEFHAPGRYFPDLMVEEATRFVTDHRDEPFFLLFTLNAPHYPYQGEPSWLERYGPLASPRREYAAFLSSADVRIGRLLGLLDDLSLRERTIVAFQSDHGHSTEARAHFGGGSAGPHRGAKFSLLEGGIRVPAAISWLGRLPENAVRDQVAHACDWFPTLAALAGVPLPERRLDGRSLVGVIEDPDAGTPHDELHWAQADQWAVRVGRWKLVSDAHDTTDGRAITTDEGARLYDLESDLGERDDLAADEPDVVADLTARHERWVETREDG